MLDDLLGKMPRWPDDVDLSYSSTLSSERRKVISRLPEPKPYVIPEIRYDTYLSPSESIENVVLIAAPAAVGKSTLARYLASQTGNPLWLLEWVRLGTFALSGLIQQLYKPSSRAFTDALNRGEVCLILDSLDEAYLKSGGLEALEHLAEDIRSISEEFVGDAPSPRLIILGRIETVGMLNILLEDEGVAHSALVVSYFSIERAKEFVEVKLSSIDASRLFHERKDMKGNFESARDTVFCQFEKLLGPGGFESPNDETTGHTFLGYAPVIESIATMLNVPDRNGYTAIQSSFAAEAGTRVWESLAQVCEMILTREKQKFEQQIRGEPWYEIAEKNEWYSIAQQVDWLRDRRRVVDRVLPPHWANEHAVDVRDKTELFLRDHPFFSQAGYDLDGSGRFANSIFEEYVHAYAYAFSTELGNGQAVPLVRPTHAYSRLMLELGKESGKSLSIAVISLVVQSLMSAARSSGTVSGVSIRETSSSEAVISLSDEDKSQGRLALDGKIVELRENLTELELDLPGQTVLLGSESEPTPVDIEGTVSIRCDKLIVGASSIDFVDSESRLLIASREIVDHGVARMNLRSDDGVDVISNSKADLPFNWQKYYRGPLPATDGRFAVATSDLKNICRWFSKTQRRSMGGHVSAGIALDQHVKRGVVDKQLFEYCLDVGFLVKNGRDYELELSTFGISWIAVRSGMPMLDENLRDFILGYVEKELYPA